MIEKFFKKKNYSAKYDFKTGFFYKISLIIGLFLLFIFLFSKIISLFLNKNSDGFLYLLYDFSNSNLIDSIFAFSILILSISFILYFFHRQFKKLAEITKEIENDLNIQDNE
jgi:hypothetical protein